MTKGKINTCAFGALKTQIISGALLMAYMCPIFLIPGKPGAHARL